MDSSTPSFVSVTAQPDAKDIFAYKMYHTFVCAMGIARLLISAAFIALGIGTAGKISVVLTVICLGIGALNPIVTPIMYLLQSAKAAAVAVPVTYSFTAEKIIANEGKKRAELTWDNIALIVWMKKEMLIYSTPYQALVLPRRQMEGKDGDVLAMLKAYANPARTVYKKLL